MGPDPSHWSARSPRSSQNAPRPRKGLAGWTSPWGPPHTCCTLGPRGACSPGPRTSQDPRLLVGRQPASRCSSTGRNEAPMSWGPYPAPWRSWSWGLWHASPGVPPWTSLKTWRVGLKPLLPTYMLGAVTRHRVYPPMPLARSHSPKCLLSI